MPDEIKNRYEVSARDYCHAKGLDPDEIIKYGRRPHRFSLIDGDVADVFVNTPRWQIVAAELRDLDLLLRALYPLIGF